MRVPRSDFKVVPYNLVEFPSLPGVSEFRLIAIMLRMSWYGGEGGRRRLLEVRPKANCAGRHGTPPLDATPGTRAWAARISRSGREAVSRAIGRRGLPACRCRADVRTPQS